jgi:hypothetical protein
MMLTLMAVCSARLACIFNEGLFFTKLVILMLIFFVTLRLDDSTMVAFANISQLFSYIFILWQVTGL